MQLYIIVKGRFSIFNVKADFLMKVLLSKV